MQTTPLHWCSISCSLLTRTRTLEKKNSNKNYPDIKQTALLEHQSILSPLEGRLELDAKNSTLMTLFFPD